MTKNWFGDNRDGGLIDEISFSFLNQDGKKPGGLSGIRGEKRDGGIVREIMPEDFCPFLGSRDDRATRLGYPSQWNHCYRHEKSAPLTMDAQTKYCLTKEFESCVIYQQEEPEKEPFFFLAWVDSARLWPKKARSFAVIVPVLLIIIAALVWWPMPGTSVEESTGNAAPLQEIVQPDENVQPESEVLPALSRRFEGKKEPVIPAEDGIDSETEIEAPTAGIEEADEKGSGGFRVRIYD